MVLDDFHKIWIIDFEFTAPTGAVPLPLCLVATEFWTRETHRLWLEDIRDFKGINFIAQNDLVVAYYASAEVGCYLSLGLEPPGHLLDLYVEFRCLTNGSSLPFGRNLLGAMKYFGITGIDGLEKEAMRTLAMRGGEYTDEEKQSLIDYCESDVVGLLALLSAMIDKIDLPRALLRGRYMSACARIERTGIPLDYPLLERLKQHWATIQQKLIEAIDQDYGVYSGGTFKQDKFAAYLNLRQIPWPLTDTGRLNLLDNTFKDMARHHPELNALRELRVTLSKMRLIDFSVGEDGRNRVMLSAFSAKTGRNQPSNSSFIFGPSVWLRGLIKPAPGYGLAYIDWSQQEFGIAAALSGDELMQVAYSSGDPYLTFAKQAGAVPQDATKLTHKVEREQFKACVLAVQYGMGAESLATRIGTSTAHARALLELHRRTYKVFWQWSDGNVNYAMLHGRLWTVFGWGIQVGVDANARSLANFPMQANGAEMLRLACCLVTEAGVRVCAPVHDAILIEAPLYELNETIERVQQLMSDASAEVLGGFRLNSDAAIVRYPDRYEDERGAKMWQTVMDILATIETRSVQG